ncbi:hypothetical protein, partial [Burkholderia glumae]|uniref:hypothetical protein n=1 Tax=Burkholderia glumae TaxID=337 RepID=UPI0019D6D3F7
MAALLRGNGVDILDRAMPWGLIEVNGVPPPARRLVDTRGERHEARRLPAKPPPPSATRSGS